MAGKFVGECQAKLQLMNDNDKAVFTVHCWRKRGHTGPHGKIFEDVNGYAIAIIWDSVNPESDGDGEKK